MQLNNWQLFIISRIWEGSLSFVILLFYSRLIAAQKPIVNHLILRSQFLFWIVLLIHSIKHFILTNSIQRVQNNYHYVLKIPWLHARNKFKNRIIRLRAWESTAVVYMLNMLILKPILTVFQNKANMFFVKPEN